MSMGIKIIGLLLIVISFVYLIKNPGQSMMEGLMKQKQKKAEEYEQAAIAEQPENESKPEEHSDIK